MAELKELSASAATLSVSSWQQRWAPSAAVDGLAAFETVEDDRADSHPAGAPHIRVEGDNFRWNMHTVDRDTSTDRQRHEVTGRRTPAGGAANGTTVDRPMDITVNGTRIAAGRSFLPTGNWDTWATASLPITLKAGTNTVRATSTTADGGPNLDRITVR
ncbi:hypothetical protein Kpho01_45140 [Kitasatospora phosalacinea]|uniref:CBM6 domain-containing protein n=1 Tax=Kitasatospora phosalacinea TaxID=2065 RepID=A0A9W6UQK4_9ACTN|nr:hypothetical protein Kpho01_45140 [Kitasatospora phosalacinea]